MSLLQSPLTMVVNPIDVEPMKAWSLVIRPHDGGMHFDRGETIGILETSRVSLKHKMLMPKSLKILSTRMIKVILITKFEFTHDPLIACRPKCVAIPIEIEPMVV